MDSTEVTNAHYAAFLAAKGGDTSGQLPECEWNTSYEPKASLGVDYPVLVDWCDASAYCAWAGKRLCGKIGGIPISPGEQARDEAVSEWYNACSRGGTRIHSYGSDYAPDMCNMFDIGPVGARPTCEGGYPGLFDLSGNADEWEDFCRPDEFEPDLREYDSCSARGGDPYLYRQNLSSCRQLAGYPRAVVRLGIRCCASSN